MKKCLLSLLLLFLSPGTAFADCDFVLRMRQFYQAARQLGEENPRKLESLQGELGAMARNVEVLVLDHDGPEQRDLLCGKIEDMILVLKK